MERKGDFIFLIAVMVKIKGIENGMRSGKVRIVDVESELVGPWNC